jgi:hypothetical protein
MLIAPLVERQAAGADHQRVGDAVPLQHRRSRLVGGGVHDDDARHGIADDEIELAGRIRWIDGHRLRASRMNGEHRHRHLDRVTEDQCHPLAASA